MSRKKSLCVEDLLMLKGEHTKKNQELCPFLGHKNSLPLFHSHELYYTHIFHL